MSILLVDVLVPTMRRTSLLTCTSLIRRGCFHSTGAWESTQLRQTDAQASTTSEVLFGIW